MPRNSTLEPTKDKSKNLWYICIPAEFSSTGKWKREYFSNREKARTRSKELKRIRRDKDLFSAKASPSLIRDAVECDSLAQIYGFSGLREAFMKWAEQTQTSTNSLKLSDLLECYESDHHVNWSPRYKSSRWKPFRKKLIDIEHEIVPLMDTDYWRAWTSSWREKENPAISTYNQTLALLRAIFRHEKAIDIFPRNPIEPIPAIKSESKEVCVSSPDAVKQLLNWVWEHDRDLTPYFALGFFAGLRPLSELEPFTFEQINFEERILNVTTTKTTSNPRRQVPLEDNIFEWLRSFEGRKGLVCPSNLVRRIRKARKESGIVWGHDIMRHSYGSYWEAFHRKDAGCREQLSYNMGHSTFKTYEQNYRNDRSSKDAEAYWSIVPEK